jgi:hypothetical protein
MYILLLLNTMLALMAMLITSSLAHMNMAYPPPRGYRGLPNVAEIDYSITSPTQQLCQGKPAGPIAAKFTAGQTVNVQLEGGAKHNGGHCQFSLSYDNGKTFVVLRTIEQHCMLDTTTYTVTIPSEAPSSTNAIFAWSWINATGNREYYMNCADVEIQGKPGGKLIGPEMLITSILGHPNVPEWGYPNESDSIGVSMLAARPTISVTAP